MFHLEGGRGLSRRGGGFCGQGIDSEGSRRGFIPFSVSSGIALVGDQMAVYLFGWLVGWLAGWLLLYLVVLTWKPIHWSTFHRRPSKCPIRPLLGDSPLDAVL